MDTCWQDGNQRGERIRPILPYAYGIVAVLATAMAKQKPGAFGVSIPRGPIQRSKRNRHLQGYPGQPQCDKDGSEHQAMDEETHEEVARKGNPRGEFAPKVSTRTTSRPPPMDQRVGARTREISKRVDPMDGDFTSPTGALCHPKERHGDCCGVRNEIHPCDAS